MQPYFFSSTKNAHLQITRLYDFVWPTAAAMWNLRWQVVGYLQAVPGATVTQLKARFTEGTNIHGANLRRACTEHTWDEQKEAFARVLLVNTVAIYEGWLDEVLESLDLGKRTASFGKALQFPDASAASHHGIRWGVTEITRTESSVLRKSFYATLRKGTHCSPSKLDAMIRCFRYFKELRNCDMHGGGNVEQRLLDAFSAFSAVVTPSVLGIAEVPVHYTPVLGCKTRLSLRGVVGFSHIVLKIVTTLDAELSRSIHAEKVFIKRWKQTHPRRLDLRAVAAQPKKAMNKAVVAAGFSPPADAEGIKKWLKQLNLVDC